MPSAEQTKSLYRRTLREQLHIRRFTGSPGPNRPFTDTPCRGRMWGERPVELIGSTNQYDYNALVFAPDLIDGGFVLPITGSDKLVRNGKEYAISFPDNATRAEGPELVAYELKVRG